MDPPARPPAKTQLSRDLPGITAYITGHKPESGETTIQDRRPAAWHPIDNNGMGFHVAFSTQHFPVSMNNDADISAHDEKVNSGKQGIVNPGGTVMRYVDFAPGFETMMHRTRSLDYGIVLEGTIELILDSGETQILQRGDCCVQRGTNHAWRNTSETEWARMVYVLQDSQPVEVGGTKLKEDLGRSAGEIPSSGNAD
ncbi:hypothetical protein ANO11243_049390 [Dothideomycetidae sp. 11243]|nr:hypothetical protein ANO11243_049390 [fungal sp. No.11243]